MAGGQRSSYLCAVTSRGSQEVVIMVAVVSSIKALWETRIRRVQDDEDEQRRKKTRGGATGRLSVRVWEDRAILARLQEKLQTEDGRLILRIEQEEWKTLPACLVQLSQVHEWHLHRTGLQNIPHFITSFQNLLILDLSRNGVTEIPKQIGQYTPNFYQRTLFNSYCNTYLRVVDLHVQ